MNTRGACGYSVVALDNPKSDCNVGGAIRAAGCYGASLVVLGARVIRVKWPTDTAGTFRHIPVQRVRDVFDAVPFDCVPVGVELVHHAQSLPHYEHPKRAFYVFGAEDGTLGKRVLERCRDVIQVPTEHCMNLAATVNVVLYDRMAKQIRRTP